MPNKIIHEKISQEKNRFESYLKKSSLKITHGRKTVFEEAIRSHGHFTAEELVKKCQSLQKKVSRATIYRSLNELKEAGVIRETAFGDKHRHFEHLYDEKPHHHARCIRCYSILEFPDLEEDLRYRPILEKKGFKVLGHEMHFYGLCRQCC